MILVEHRGEKAPQIRIASYSTHNQAVMNLYLTGEVRETTFPAVSRLFYNVPTTIIQDPRSRRLLFRRVGLVGKRAPTAAVVVLQSLVAEVVV